jgi:hypothetical protein
MSLTLKALKEGRLVAYATDSNDPLPVSYWEDKTVDWILRTNGVGFRLKSEDVMRVFPRRG